MAEIDEVEVKTQSIKIMLEDILNVNKMLWKHIAQLEEKLRKYEE